jgi:His-Xaa-Ser system protein HxsD
MSHVNFIKEDEINAFADVSLFSKEAIFKCLYWYGDKFHANVAFADSQTYLIKLKAINNLGINEDELDLYLQKLERDLIDYQLRDTITKETQNVRDLLVAKAFSNGEFDENPPGEVSDPVGFNPNEINNTNDS